MLFVWILMLMKMKQYRTCSKFLNGSGFFPFFFPLHQTVVVLSVFSLHFKTWRVEKNMFWKYVRKFTYIGWMICEYYENPYEINAEINLFRFFSNAGRRYNLSINILFENENNYDWWCYIWCDSLFPNLKFTQKKHRLDI